MMSKGFSVWRMHKVKYRVIRCIEGLEIRHFLYGRLKQTARTIDSTFVTSQSVEPLLLLAF